MYSVFLQGWIHLEEIDFSIISAFKSQVNPGRYVFYAIIYIHSNSTPIRWQLHTVCYCFFLAMANYCCWLSLWYRCSCRSLIVLFSFFCSWRCALPSSGLNDAYERKREQDCCCSRLSPPDSLFSFRFLVVDVRGLPSSGLNDAYKETKRELDVVRSTW